MRNCFTILELLIVVVIMTVLFTLAFPAYRAAQKRAQIRRVENMLLQVRSQEQVHRQENYAYISCSDLNDCNSKLNLEIATDWHLSVSSVTPHTFCAQATDGTNTFSIRQDEIEPVSGGCP